MTDTTGAIRELDIQRREAMVAADLEALDSLFSDDLKWIHATARVDSKSALLTSIGSGSTKYFSIDVEDEEVRVFGKCALLSGIARMKAEIKGEPRTMNNRFTIVWAATDRSWQVVNWQSTPLPVS